MITHNAVYRQITILNKYASLIIQEAQLSPRDPRDFLLVLIEHFSLAITVEAL